MSLVAPGLIGSTGKPVRPSSLRDACEGGQVTTSFSRAIAPSPAVVVAAEKLVRPSGLRDVACARARREGSFTIVIIQK